jgi:hypothetical protein
MGGRWGFLSKVLPAKKAQEPARLVAMLAEPGLDRVVSQQRGSMSDLAGPGEAGAVTRK